MTLEGVERTSCGKSAVSADPACESCGSSGISPFRVQDVTEKPDLGEHRPLAAPTIPPRPVGPGGVADAATPPRHVRSGREAQGRCVANRASRRAAMCVAAPCRTDRLDRDVSGRVILSGDGDDRIGGAFLSQRCLSGPLTVARITVVLAAMLFTP